MSALTIPLALAIGDTTAVEATAGNEVAVPTLIVNAINADTITLKYRRASTGVTTAFLTQVVTPGAPMVLPKPLLLAPGDRLIINSFTGQSAALLSADISGVATSGAINVRVDNGGAYYAGANYAVRDLINYGGDGYICAVAHTANAAFDPSKWVKFVSKGAPANAIRYALGGGDGDNPALTRDGQGRLARIDDQVEGLARVTTYTYQSASSRRIASITVAYSGLTRTTTYTYTDGRITSAATTES